MNEQISKLISTLGIKKIEFAKRLGVSSPFVSEMCSGAKKPSDRTISDICREFNVNENWLRTGKGEMFVKQETFSLDEYAKSREASEFELDLAKMYFSFPPDIRKMMMDSLKKCVEDAKTATQPIDVENEPPATQLVQPSAQSDTAAEIAELKHQLKEVLALNEKMVAEINALKEEGAEERETPTAVLTGIRQM